MGIQERFDEICEKYELRDGDAAGEAWGFVDGAGEVGVLWMGAAVILWFFLGVLVEVFVCGFSKLAKLPHNLGWVFQVAMKYKEICLHTDTVDWRNQELACLML